MKTVKKEYLPSYEQFKEFLIIMRALASAQGAEISSRMEYGIRFTLDTDGNPSSAAAGQRVMRYDGAIAEWSPNFTANVGDGTAVTTYNENDFDLIDIFAPERWVDDAGNIFRRFKPFYWGRQKLGGYLYIWVCETPIYSFYKMPSAFIRNGKVGYRDIGVYEGGTEIINDVTYLCSKSGKNPMHNCNRTTFNNRAKAWETYLDVDTDKEWYGITQMSEITEILQPLLIIMFGTRHSQSVFNGSANFNSTYCNNGLAVEAYDETTMTLYFSTDIRTNFRVGATANVNNSTNEDYYRRVIANGTVTGTIEGTTFTASEEGTTYYYVTIEGESFPATPATLWIRPLYTGETDVIEATNGTLSNSGYYSFKVLGIENIWGNIWTQILDVSMYDYVPYKLKDPYTFTEFSTATYTTYYTATNYEACQSGWSYVKQIGYDEAMPDVQFPIEVGGSSTTYYCDQYYVSAGAKTCYFGGRLGSGSSDGLFCWVVNYGVGYSSWGIGARLSHWALREDL